MLDARGQGDRVGFPAVDFYGGLCIVEEVSNKPKEERGDAM